MKIKAHLYQVKLIQEIQDVINGKIANLIIAELAAKPVLDELMSANGIFLRVDAMVIEADFPRL